MSDPQHIAYEVALKALREAKQRALQDFLGKVDSYDPDDMDDVDSAIMGIERAFELCQHAQKIARQMMQSHDHSKAAELLRKRLPGYSDATYTQAVNEAFARQSR